VGGGARRPGLRLGGAERLRRQPHDRTLGKLINEATTASTMQAKPHALKGKATSLRALANLAFEPDAGRRAALLFLRRRDVIALSTPLITARVG
jgi:hypothetical protein